MTGKCGEVSDKEGITGGLPDAIYVPYLQSFAERLLRLAWASTIKTSAGCGVLEVEIRAARQRTREPWFKATPGRLVGVASIAAHEYRKLFDQFGMAPSMSRRENCYDNALHEKPLGIAKMN
ncbi:MAG: hypothetical protein Q8K74_07350 [Candidatus Nitrotoga sp.]|nr:hypothetical protein [Candidatus Nitrotoga sp.]MDP1855847.1 hypothetical protein [Candidatus Nitrotoga sp.]